VSRQISFTGHVADLVPDSRRCEELLSKAFAQQSGEGQYVLLRSEQLVGTAIFTFVRSELLPHITRVEGASRKVSIGVRRCAEMTY
jgi:hypothetical protein